jgi:hypothetical protein
MNAAQGSVQLLSFLKLNEMYGDIIIIKTLNGIFLLKFGSEGGPTICYLGLIINLNDVQSGCCGC